MHQFHLECCLHGIMLSCAMPVMPKGIGGGEGGGAGCARG